MMPSSLRDWSGIEADRHAGDGVGLDHLPGRGGGGLVEAEGGEQVAVLLAELGTVAQLVGEAWRVAEGEGDAVGDA